MALIATSVAFGTVTKAINPLKIAFNLTNAEVGLIGGVTLWGFAISIVIFGPLVDAMGMKTQLRVSWVLHLLGSTVMILAADFWMLFLGGLCIALANGIVEAACNPLVATLYPDRKTAKLNQFHVWFPGGIAIGALAGFALERAGLPDYRLLLALNLVPALIYGLLIWGQRFPQTERVQQGVSNAEMFRATFTRPLFWILLVCMAMTASLELGPGRWMTPILESGGLPGILILAYGSILMAVLRYFAGPVVKRVPPLVLLLISAIVSGLGLLAVSYSVSLVEAALAATVFYVGVCYFWPTMLGVTSERIPKGGSLALALMGASGMLVVGGVTVDLLGVAVDKRADEVLQADHARDVARTLNYFGQSLDDPTQTEGLDPETVAEARAAADQVVQQFVADGTLHPEAASALRYVVAFFPESVDGGNAATLLNDAENVGGRAALRLLTPLAVILAVVFGLLFLTQPRRRETPLR
ncbi:MAG: sugar MFS transporter [Opitutales bacterium]